MEGSCLGKQHILKSYVYMGNGRPLLGQATHNKIVWIYGLDCERVMLNQPTCT